jgi:hypothetical protein
VKKLFKIKYLAFIYARVIESSSACVNEWSYAWPGGSINANVGGRPVRRRSRCFYTPFRVALPQDDKGFDALFFESRCPKCHGHRDAS